MGLHGGLSYSLWRPSAEPAGGVLILPGAGSVKESHHDFARACRAAGFAALVFDQRGHGESEGELGAGVLEDIAAMVELLDVRPLALRGSSMGGYFALMAAERVHADAVVAICPAGAGHLLTGLRADALNFRADRFELERFLSTHDAGAAVEKLEAPLLLLHADGDETIPIEHSRELRRRAVRSDRAKLVELPGGHHRSVQHDPELQGYALRFLARAFRPRSGRQPFS
jgi:pimeloyl-ACP methyl ester carboxylesterase